jgi:hypothetical protein
MRRAAALALLVAFTLLMAAVAVALVPVRATPVEYVADRGATSVDCGSFPFRTEWSGDAGCDKARSRRLRLSAPFVLASAPIGLAGAVLLLASRHRQHS